MPRVVNVRIPDTIIGLGAINNIGDVAKSFAPTRVLIITDAGIVKAGILQAVKSPLENASLQFDVYDGCKEKPTRSLLEELSQRVKTNGYDLLIGVGGGSIMDSTKAVSVVAANDSMSIDDLIKRRAAEKSILKILIPTTAGTGSEWSNVAVIYEDGLHGRPNPTGSLLYLANKVIIDPELTLSMPPKVTADSGIDALTQAIEAYVNPNASVFSDMLAGTAIQLIADNLRLAYLEGNKNIEARYNMSIGAAMAMNAGITSGLGLVHFMGDVCNYGITHGRTLALLLPAIMEYNLTANPAKFAKIAEIMGVNISGLSDSDAAIKAVEAVREIIRDLDLPQRMSDVGITEANISEMTSQFQATKPGMIALMNPRDASAEDIAQIFKAAL